MRNNLSKNWKSIIFYILIPLLLIGSIFLFSSQSRSVDKNYSEIVALSEITRLVSLNSTLTAAS